MAEVRSLGDAQVHITSLENRVRYLERMIRDHDGRFCTLQTPLWKRVVFRIDGWPGQRDLLADAPAWRPWRRWWTS